MTRGRWRSWRRVRCLEHKLKQTTAINDWSIGHPSGDSTYDYVKKQVDRSLRGLIGQPNVPGTIDAIKQSAQYSLEKLFHALEQQGVLTEHRLRVHATADGVINADIEYRETSHIGSMSLKVRV